MKQCPYCGVELSDESLFCTECGKELPKGNVCPHCGALVNEGDVFCMECGKAISEKPTSIAFKEVKDETPPPPKKKPCPYCGYLMDENDVSCDNCGRLVVEGIEEEQESGNNTLKKYLPYIVGIILALVLGGFWLSSQEGTGLRTDSLATADVSEASEEVIPKEKLEDILKELVGIADINVIPSKVNKYCTEEFKTSFNKAWNQADKGGCEYPRLWWSYSDDDPSKYEITKIVMTSNNVAKADVKISGEMYIGRFNVLVKKEKDAWLIDKIDEVETVNNPDFDISDNTDGSSSTIEMSGNNDIRVKEYQEKTMRCVGKIQDIMRQINSIYNSYVSASIRIDDIRKQSLGVNAIADISDLIIKGDDIFKEMIRLANEYGQQGNISTLRAEQEDFKKQGYQMSTNIRRDIYNENY